MLSEEAKRELREFARSEKVREDFELLRALNRKREAQLTADQILRFLTDTSRLFAPFATPRPFVPYTNVRL